MTKLEEARKIIEMWTIRADPHVLPQVSPSFSADLDALIRAAKDEEAEECAKLHENIDTACDHERLSGHPGAAGMAPVIQYRDAIRARIAARAKGE